MDQLNQTERYVYVKAHIPREVYERLLERHNGHVPYLLRELRLEWQRVLDRQLLQRIG